MIFDEKRLNEIRQRIKNYIRNNLISTKKKDEFSNFFLINSKKSLNSAQALFDLSTNKDLQTQMGYTDFDGFLWVINASYYSMFYMVRALLENKGIKLRADLSIHLLTCDSLVNFFYLNHKLEKIFIEDFTIAKNDAGELLGKEKANELITDYFLEKTKRASFTYNTQKIAMQNKAKTSLIRAVRFNQEIRKLIN